MSIKRNSIYNLAGALTPLAVTLLTVPLYLAAIGEARYGLLALVWLILGYFGFFDLGLSTATTNALAQSDSDSPDVRARIFFTSFITQSALGITIAVILLVAAPFLLDRASLPLPLKSELGAVLPWLALAIPLVTVGGVLSGVLTAREEFGHINLISVLGSVLFQAVPLWAAYSFGPELHFIIPAAVIARAVPVILTGLMVGRRIDLRLARFDGARLRALLTYGAWIMITTLVGPLLTSADQFIVGGVLGTSALAAYSIAYSLAVRLAIIPGALGQTMFPRLSRVTGEEADALAGQALRSIMLVMTLVCLPALLLARPFIAWWISPAFAATAAPVTELLLIAMWINGLAMNPFMLLRSRGRPDLTAKFHLLEFIPYVVALYAGVTWLGLIGVALAGLFRVTLDTVLLYRASRLPLDNLSLLPVASAVLLAALLVARSGLLGWPMLLALAIVAGGLFGLFMLRVDPLLRGWAVSLWRGVHQRMFA